MGSVAVRVSQSVSTRTCPFFVLNTKTRSTTAVLYTLYFGDSMYRHLQYLPCIQVYIYQEELLYRLSPVSIRTYLFVHVYVLVICTPAPLAHIRTPSCSFFTLNYSIELRPIIKTGDRPEWFNDRPITFCNAAREGEELIPSAAKA